MHKDIDLKIGDLVKITINGDKNFYTINKYDDNGASWFQVKQINSNIKFWVSKLDVIKINKNLKVFL